MKYIPYKIKQEDTLKSLASRIGLYHYKQLLNFHNSVSNKANFLKTDKLIKGNVLYIPDIEEITQLNRDFKNEQDAQPTKQIPKLELSKLKATYKVKISKENFGNSTENRNIITYELKIDQIETNESSTILKIEKDNFLVNNRKPQSKMQQLALQCASTYYPMEIVVNEWGRIKNIQNMAQIRARWTANRTKIENNFTGSYVDSYLNNLENKLYNTNQLETIINDDIVFQTLFLPYKTLTDQQESTISSHFFKHHIQYKIVQEIETDNEKENELLIRQEGIIDDHRSYRDLLDPEVPKNNPYAVPMPKTEGVLNNSFIIDTIKEIPIKIDAYYEINYTPNKCKKTHININLINKS